jgi:class 3 adenylate cyclase
MAVFQTPAEALHAALAMQAGIADLNTRQQLSDDEALILKVGLHSGPCLTVTLNDRPDYFGATVNLAARVQTLSRGNDIVFTDLIRADPLTETLVQGRQLDTMPTTLKGIEGEVCVHRLSLGA